MGESVSGGSNFKVQRYNQAGVSHTITVSVNAPNVTGEIKLPQEIAEQLLNAIANIMQASNTQTRVIVGNATAPLTSLDPVQLPAAPIGTKTMSPEERKHVSDQLDAALRHLDAARKKI